MESNSTPNMITWDKAKLKRLKAAMAAAPGDIFEFEGNEFVKSYAKYLIQYLEVALDEPTQS